MYTALSPHPEGLPCKPKSGAYLGLDVAVPSAVLQQDLFVCLTLQIELTASDWDECSVWLTALKRLIKIRQALG